MNSDPQHIPGEEIRQPAASLGFNACGIAAARQINEYKPLLDTFVAEKRQAGMQYLDRNRPKMIDPSTLLPGVRSIISLAKSYYTGKQQKSAFRIAKYAWGKDYHHLMTELLSRFVEALKGRFPGYSYKHFVDAGPILEKAWAQESGIGWIGKNTLLIHPKLGSFHFLGEVLTDMPISSDQPGVDHCGTCTRCLDACPNGALIAPRQLDASRCISYLNKTQKIVLEEDLPGKLHGWIFGCDICQDVCPWNQDPFITHDIQLQPRETWLNMNDDAWETLPEPQFQVYFKNTPLEGLGFDKIQRNIRVVKKEMEAGLLLLPPTE